MSLKIYNTTTGLWEKSTTLLASGIKVTDLEGKYESATVNGCLVEIDDKFLVMKDAVQYIRDHAGSGGGGGGGGSSVPTVTVEGNKQLVVKSDEILDIYYTFTSPNVGNGTVSLTYGNSITILDISQGRNKWRVGPFIRGVYTLSISIEDKQGYYTVPAQIEVISGALELTTTFSDNRDFSLATNISIVYQALTEIPEIITLTYKFNSEPIQTETAIKGANTLALGLLPYMGVSYLTMQLHNSMYDSNILKFVLVASDSETLFLSTTFEALTFQLYQNIQFDYRISMRDQYEFDTKLYIDDLENPVDTIKSPPGVNNWVIGPNLTKGLHTVKVETCTVDGISKKTLTKTFEVLEVGYTPYRHVRTDLIAEFIATAKSNSSTNKGIWEDTSGNSVGCTLHNFNYESNGWIVGTDSLSVSGKAYAEINLAPFLNGVKNGFSFDMLYKTKCVGNIDAKVMSCKNPDTPYQGIEINSYEASISTSLRESAAVKIQDNVFTKITYVVDRLLKILIIYVNGVLSSVAYLRPNNLELTEYRDEFTYDGKILLGCGKNVVGDIVNNSVSEIKNVRIYSKALSHQEVLQNYISDKNEEEQTTLKKINFLDRIDEGTPTLSFTGGLFELMDENAEMPCTISYNDPNDSSKTKTFDGCSVAWQGTSSKTYPVKNWTMKLKKGGAPVLDFTPKDEWKPEEKWTIKANYMDSSHSNNVGINKFVYDFFKPYPYPCQDIDPMTRGNVDGFPVKLVINQKYVGTYTWNIDRYAANNYGFMTYNANGTINRNASAVSYEIAVNGTNGAAAFKLKEDEPATWDSIRKEFKCRYNYNGDDSIVLESVASDGININVLKSGMHDELKTLVYWVATSTDPQFYGELKNHFSVRHLIDYYLITYMFGMVDNLGKNMVISSWGKENGYTMWYPSFYDCDSVLGLTNNGHIFYDAGIDPDKGDYNTSGSNLWTKLVRTFSKEIRERYCELRLPRTINGVSSSPMFSHENIMSYLGGKIIDVVGQRFYNEDAFLKYIAVNHGESIQDEYDKGLEEWVYLCNGTRKEYTERWLKERFIYLDSVYEFNYDKDTVMRSFAMGDLILNVKTYSPMWIKISFSSGLGSVMRLRVDQKGFTEFKKYIDNDKDNEIKVYGSDNIMYLDGIKELNVASINIGKAPKLVELDLSGNKIIQELSLSNNSYLQRVICNDCEKLGADVIYKTLDLSSCKNLKELTCNRTHIANIMFSEEGGVIETLNCSDTDITSFVLKGQEYLNTIVLTGCSSINELVIDKCNGLNSVTVTDTKLSAVNITGCINLDYLNISRTKSLRTLNLAGCLNLKTLIMAGVSNPGITDLDLRNSLKLETLDISSSSYIQTLTFGQYTENGVTKNYSALKNLICSNSTIKTIRYGITAPINAYLDLAGLTLNTISFSSCTNLVDIRNINFEATGSSQIFYNCYNLISVQGYMKLKNSIYIAFYNCSKLVTLPTLDLSGVTSMSQTFEGCQKFTMTHLTKIMNNSGLGPNFTGSYRVFCNCKGIIGALPATLFNSCTALTSISEFFNSCSGITGPLPVTLLAPMTNLVDCYHAFSSCSGINGVLPLDFLRYNTRITSTYRMFYGTSITSASLDTLLKYALSLTTTYGMFQECKALEVTIPDTLFVFNRQLNSIGAMFSGCPLVYGTIPRNLINNIPKIIGSTTKCYLRNFEYFFNGTKIDGQIPAYISEAEKGFLDSGAYIDSIEGLFQGCNKITGSIPTDFLLYNNNIVRANGLFNGCTLIDGLIPEHFLKSKTLLISVGAMFKGCPNIISPIPQGFLDDCPLVTNVSELFSGCFNLNGTIPTRVSTWELRPYELDPSIMVNTEVVTKYGIFDNCVNIVNANAVFENCSNISSEIPPTLLMNAGRVTSIDNIFSNCYELYGPIPEKLFENCRLLTTMSGAFHNCRKLYNYIVDEDNPYALPPDLFKNCINLTNINYAFDMWNWGDGKLNGQLPPKLFVNNVKLLTAVCAFRQCTKLTGEISSSLFATNVKLTDAQYAFDSTGFTSIGSQLFNTCTKLKNMTCTFNNCTKLTGLAPTYWSQLNPVQASDFSACFRGDTLLSNYAEILGGWK